MMRRRRKWRALVGMAAVSCALLPPETYANCSNSFKQWVQDAALTGSPASLPVTDTGFSSLPTGPRSRTHFTHGTQLFTIYNENFPQGCSPGTGDACAPTGGTCIRLSGCKLPTWSAGPAVPLGGVTAVQPSTDPTRAYLFLGDHLGRLHRVDVTFEPPYPSISVDTRRPSCVGDRLLGTPAVQLYRFSNVAFKVDVDEWREVEDDVVFVVTAAGCGDATHNRVIAYWASDLTKKWEFNAPRLPGQETGPIRMGVGREGCAIAYHAASVAPNNRLFCGTDAPPRSVQHSLWALDTITGRLIWSDNPGGSVVGRPALFFDRLYAVSQSGSLWAYAPGGNGLGGPRKLWTTGLSVASPGAFVDRSPWVETREGTWQNKILTLDSSGKLYAVQDDGATGSILWAIRPTDSGRWVSAPVVVPGPSESKAFIGRDDGHLQMIKLDGGQPQGTIQIASSTAEHVYDPAIDTDPAGNPRVVVVGGSKVARIAVPICTDDPAPGASVCFDECFVPQGSPPDWNPYCSGDGCRTYSCRDPGWNPEYNPCRALDTPSSACIAHDYPGCVSGGIGCTDQGAVLDGTACDDAWPGAPGAPYERGSATCRADSIPEPVACDLTEGDDCTGLGLPRHKCVTKPAVCGGVGGKCCVCNDGYGMDCNDRCYKGQCVSDRMTGCAGGQDVPCIVSGDRACAPGLTCCGSDKGAEPSCSTDAECMASPQGRCLDINPLDADPMRRCYYQRCVDLSDDPQHCGACGADCGEYAISADSCTDDVSCGSCTSDAECAAVGGKCADGACGKCRTDTTATGQPMCGTACTIDAQCGGGQCTNGFCCAAGTECVGGSLGSCLPLVCHRLVNPGVCAAGVCAGSAPCTGPDAADLQLAALPGMCSVDFEFTTEPDGTSMCGAYVTGYGADPSLARVDETGAITAYTPEPTDPSLLNGVAVSRDGSNVLAAMVDDVGFAPGLAFRDAGTIDYSRVFSANPTGGADNNPFDEVEFNKGPVGPALDYVTFSGSNRTVWLGNFDCAAGQRGCTCRDLELCRITWGPLDARPEPYCNQPCVDPTGLCAPTPCEISGPSERITAIAFGRLLNQPTNLYHRFLILAHGTTLSFFDLDAAFARQRDVNLASPAVCLPDTARGESTVEAILSIAPTPYGDVIVEVRGAGDKPSPGNVKNTWLINVNAHDFSCRHELDVQRSVRHVNPCGQACTNSNQCGGGTCTNGFCCGAGFTCSERVCVKSCFGSGQGGCPEGFLCQGGPVCRIAGEVPPNFGTGVSALSLANGRLAAMPGGRLLRWEVAVGQPPANLEAYDTVPPVDCADADACTSDSFDSQAGQCVHLPVTCDDQDLCTADGCSQLTGQCIHTPFGCDDSVACTLDSCEPATGACVHTPIALGEPEPAEFISSASIQWPPTPDATHWNTYRGTIPAGLLGSRPPGAWYDQICHESADALGDGPTASTDAAVPLMGTAFYYLVSGEAGCESAIGHASSGAPIPNASPCP